MKKIIIVTLALLFLPIFESFGQQLSQDSLRLQKIIDVPNASSDSIQKMVIMWFESKYFIAEPDVPKSITKTQSKIKCEYSIDYRFGGSWYRATQTIIIEVKDNLTRVSIDSPKKIYRMYLNDKKRKNNWEELKKYDRDLQFLRDSWRKNIESLKEWFITGYRITEDEANKNANW